MADEQASNSGGGEQHQQQQGGAGAPAQRPEYIPEKFWDGEKGAPKLEDLGKSYSDLADRQAKGKAGLIPVIKAEIEAERFKNRPAKPEDYKISVPKAGLPADLVILPKQPDKDFKPEAGKRYFVVNEKDPMWQFWRQTAHEAGLGQEGFDKGLAAYASARALAVPTEEQQKQAAVAEYAKLGEHGAARADHVWKGLNAAVGEKAAKALDGVVGSAAGIEALEALLEKSGGTKFMPAGGTDGGADAPTMAQVRELMADPDYWNSSEKRQAVADMIGKMQKKSGASRAA